jgi:hypothetical protein
MRLCCGSIMWRQHCSGWRREIVIMDHPEKKYIARESNQAKIL